MQREKERERESERRPLLQHVPKLHVVGGLLAAQHEMALVELLAGGRVLVELELEIHRSALDELPVIGRNLQAMRKANDLCARVRDACQCE